VGSFVVQVIIALDSVMLEPLLTPEIVGGVSSGGARVVRPLSAMASFPAASVDVTLR
jgi:hypothetical protein